MDHQQRDEAVAKDGTNDAYLARKTHRKSRLGCVECKRRRVKVSARRSSQYLYDTLIVCDYSQRLRAFDLLEAFGSRLLL